MTKNTKIFFVSDAHFGALGKFTSEKREQLFIEWLDTIKTTADELILNGDIFDFWFEYKYVVPRGFAQVIAKLKELSDSGIKIVFVCGNHDMWVFDYLPEAIGAQLVRDTYIKTVNGKKLFIAHGDGLGPYDKKYNFLKSIFRNKFFQFLFKIIHPEISFRIANAWSKSSRKRHKLDHAVDYEKEHLVQFSKKVLEKEHYDFFIFGHRHIPMHTKIGNNSTFINLGDWLFNFSYAEFDGEKIELKFYLDDQE